MKKKLLLVGVAAMGLLAVGVGATSTFAWYQATLAGYVKTTTATDTAVSVTKVETLDRTEIDAKFVLERVTGNSGKSLQLTHWHVEAESDRVALAEAETAVAGYNYYDASTGGSPLSVTAGSTSVEAGKYKAQQSHYEYKAYDANGVLQDAALKSTNVSSWGYQIKWKGTTGAGAALSTEQVNALKGAQVTFSKLTVGTSERIAMWFSGSSISDDSDPVFDGGVLVNSITVTLPNTIAASTDLVLTDAFCGIYVDGEQASESYANRDTANLTLTCGINVTGNPSQGA